MTDQFDERSDVVIAALRRFEPPPHLPGFQPDLRDRLQELAPPAQREVALPRRVLITIAAAAAALALAMSGLALLTPSEIATAADVRAAVSEAWSEARDVTGVAVFAYPDGRGGMQQWPYAFTINDVGAYVVEDLVNGTVWASDWSSNTGLIAYGKSRGPKGEKYGEQRGLPLGPPDADPFAFFNRGLASINGGVGGAGNPQVKEIEHRGREAWLLRAAVPRLESSPASGDRLDITVDQESGIPVRVVETRDGALVSETLIQDVRLNSEVPAETFELEVPTAAEVNREDYGFRRVSLGEVRARLGYSPRVPAWVPDGYSLAEVQIAETAAPAGTNPASRDVVMLGYRRGLELFVVTSRRTGPEPGTWTDPFNRPGVPAGRAEPVIISGGQLDGVRAELVTDARSVPHVWTATPELVVTVGGDLGRDELLRVARSLG